MKTLTPEERDVGKENYYAALGVNRRDFLREVVGAGAVSGAGLGAAYFGYSKVKDPLRVGVIGTGDEGGVLIGAVNPEYIDVVAISDIRPSSIYRAFHGDCASDAALHARPGLMSKYGWKSEDEARKHVKVFDGTNGGWQELLKEKDVEAVIIALPLFLHAPVAVAAMKAGKHVLTEKLMAHNVAQCKVMGRVAEEQKLHLATGHQRHYSILYDNAVKLLSWGVLGELHHIRAQWHRGNLPGKDSWQQPVPGGEKLLAGGGKKIDDILKQLNKFKDALAHEKNSESRAMLERQIAQWTAWNSDKDLKAEDHGYEELTLSNGRVRTALEELVRWRLWARTGGGLMAELGSHQLDAASIFVSALRKDGKKAHPLNVHAVGGRHIFPLDRDAEDHVYCMYEFPGPGYDYDFKVGYKDVVSGVPDPKAGIPDYSKDPNKRIVVTYSSINGNGYGGYGEVVMGTRGTLILEREQDVMVYKDAATTTRVNVKDEKGGPTMDTQASGPPAGAAIAKAASEMGPVSRGYTEEIEHWAWCIRNPAPENKPRCHPAVALGDAVIALTTNVAIARANRGEGGYVPFEEEWYEIHSEKTPDGSSPKDEYEKLIKV